MLLRFAGDLDYANVLSHVHGEGHFNPRYTFMVIISVGIATLGLLLNSPAVIIGAMLISPLMGPIVSLGFALCTIDYTQMKSSLRAMLAGTVLALLASFLIVTLSPLVEPTGEILARTHPNLFDLLVAVLSGLAAGYAVIHNRGAAIVGVAIATALMPPLAVAGYGLAVFDMAIAGGAFFLFMTNLLAIALSVAMLAKWYGFATAHSPRYVLWQSGITIVVFLTLSIPLAFALKEIAYQTYQTQSARKLVSNYFEKKDERLDTLSMHFTDGGGVSVDIVALAPSYDEMAKHDLTDLLTKSLQVDVVVNLDQVILGGDELSQKRLLESVLHQALQQPQLAKANRQSEISMRVRQSLLLPIKSLAVDDDLKRIIVYVQPQSDVSLAEVRRVEQRLAERFPEWVVNVIPAVQHLPNIYFAEGQVNTSSQEQEKLAVSAWALQRWDVREVVVHGYVSGGNTRHNRNLAIRRAQAVEQYFNANKIATHVRVVPRTSVVREEERQFGEQYSRRVEVGLYQKPEIIPVVKAG
ncbi:MAG: DUF389 domain-containing protein [Gammaproteobacteria bacterium]|nr:DUF389 domain-containing protein [Gammaproteobacteria bacterium]